MSQASAEEAMRRACEAIMAGDYVTAMADVTPEALGQAIGLGAGLTNIPLPESFEIESRGELDSEQRFSVCFRAEAKYLNATIGWREIDGAWRISSIGLDDSVL